MRDGVFHRVFLLIIRAVVPFQVFEDPSVFGVGNHGRISDVVHIPDDIVRPGEEVDKRFRRVLLVRIALDAALQFDPSVEIYVCGLFRNGKIQSKVILIRLIHRIYRIA